MKLKLFVPVVIISRLPSWMPVKLRIKLTIFSEVQFFYGEEDLYYNKQSAFCCFEKIFQYLPWWMTYSLPNTRTFWIKHWLCWIKLDAMVKTVLITAFYHDLRKTITTLNWVKYPDTSMTSKSIIFQSQKLRQRSDLHDNEKLGCFEVTTFSDPWITKLIFIYKSISDNSGKWSDI